MAASFVEQSCLSKGGLSGIYGEIINGINYGLNLSDFLLMKAVGNEKYDEVMCVHLDRSEASFARMKDRYSRISFKSPRVPIISPESQDLKSIVQSNMLELLREINSVITQRKNLQKLNQENIPRLTIFIYSLSEIVLHLGTSWTLKWLKQLNMLLSPISQSPTEKSDPIVSVTVLIHTSLHPPSFLFELRSLIPIAVTLTPNLSGIYSSSILCTVKTVRCSMLTSKITEGIDFFSFDSQDIFLHVSTNHFASTGSVATETERVKESTDVELLKNLSLGEMSEGVPQGGQQTSSQEGCGGVKQSSFMILNQQDDDEELDDDPDADLDL